MRIVLAAISAIVMLGYSAYSVFTTWIFPSNQALKTECDHWLEKPKPSWVSLRGCVLDLDNVILESDQGDFETLENRKNGLSFKPYPVPPTWIGAWIPIRTDFKGSAGLVRAAYRVSSTDTLKWLNDFERADEKKKDKMWADPAPIRRLARPGVLVGNADRPQTESLQKAFGPAASPNLLAVVAGEPPPLTPPVLGLLSGIFGLASLLYATRRRPVEHELTAEQMITNLNVSDVKVEIGALEALRQEEREKKRNRKID